MSYLYRLLVALDQFFNTLFGGYPDETISSRIGKHAERGRPWACTFDRVLGWLFRDPDHCRRSIERNEGSQ